MVTSDLEKFPMNGREPGRLRMIVKGSLHSLPTTLFSRTSRSAWSLEVNRNFAVSEKELLRQSRTSNMN